MRLPQILKDILTTRDGESYDVIRVGMVVGGTSLIALSGWDTIVNRNPFHPALLGAGLAAIFAGGGFGVGAKVKDEPDA